MPGLSPDYKEYTSRGSEHALISKVVERGGSFAIERIELERGEGVVFSKNGFLRSFSQKDEISAKKVGIDNFEAIYLLDENSGFLIITSKDKTVLLNEKKVLDIHNVGSSVFLSSWGENRATARENLYDLYDLITFLQRLKEMGS